LFYILGEEETVFGCEWWGSSPSYSYFDCGECLLTRTKSEWRSSRLWIFL
jgi:hypothetical protein